MLAREGVLAHGDCRNEVIPARDIAIGGFALDP
jgi:hypothetical protein